MNIDPMVWRLSEAHPRLRPQWLRDRMVPALRIGPPARRLEDVVKKVRAAMEKRPEPKRVIILPPPTDAPKKTQKPQCKAIAQEVIDYYKLSTREFYSRRRDAICCKARHVAYYLCRELTQASMPEIGKNLDGRDHTTILHGLRKIEALLPTDRQLAADIAFLTKRLGGDQESEAQAA